MQWLIYSDRGARSLNLEEEKKLESQNEITIVRQLGHNAQHSDLQLNLLDNSQSAIPRRRYIPVR